MNKKMYRYMVLIMVLTFCLFSSNAFMLALSTQSEVLERYDSQGKIYISKPIKVGGFNATATPTRGAMPTITVTPTQTSTPTPTSTLPPVPKPTPYLTINNYAGMIPTGHDIVISASISDDWELSKVEFYVNNKKVGEAFNKPYNITCELPYSMGYSNELTAKAYDLEGRLLLSIYKLIQVYNPTQRPTSTPIPSLPLLNGYVSNDFGTESTESNNIDNSGFKVEILRTGMTAYTNGAGYFEFTQSGIQNGVYTIRISKNNCIKREIHDVQLSYGKTAKYNKITMITGDIEVDGVQDGVINMIDAIQVAKYFNLAINSPNYEKKVDLNGDGAINIADIVIIANNFNKTTSTYDFELLL